MTKVFDLLLSRQFISQEQYHALQEYQKLRIFSIRNELLFLLYLSILMFTSGVGVLIYKNIDTIGHTILLILLGIITVGSFIFCFKNAKGFSNEEVTFDNPLYEYLVLFTAILSCTFIGYFQYNLNLTYSNYNFSTLLSALLCLGMAYYFDNKNVLVIGITALASFVGLSLNVPSFFDNGVFNTSALIISGIMYGVFLLLWDWYVEKQNIKAHFSFVILTFALHTLALACLAGALNEYDLWFVYLLVLGAVVYFFYKKSLIFNALSWYAFVCFYAYIGLNILIFKIFDKVNSPTLFDFLTFLSPFYFIGSILLFIKLIKDFKAKVHVSQ